MHGPFGFLAGFDSEGLMTEGQMAEGLMAEGQIAVLPAGHPLAAHGRSLDSLALAGPVRTAARP
ncbi:hypothetical protein ACFYXP_38620 [Streptomyces sp. NPDC002466]|uniref:hypothetical protein n=1 Tax=unclassified Streptomyces TaxID=2593676 RepID=UPI0035E0B10C